MASKTTRRNLYAITEKFLRSVMMIAIMVGIALGSFITWLASELVAMQPYPLAIPIGSLVLLVVSIWWLEWRFRHGE